MVIKYTVVNVEIPYPIKFPYPANVHEFLCDIILSLTYPVKFTYPVTFTYPIKDSTLKSSYFSRVIIISCINHQV